jgi:murein DD-endopeptidase MepM/ murein hydrolase activator NlpD
MRAGLAGWIVLNRFLRDAEGNLVYTDEVSGPFLDQEYEITSEYHKARDKNSIGGHSGIDASPTDAAEGEFPVTRVLSGSAGEVVRIGARGFGDSAVIVKTDSGAYVVYGHSSSTTMTKGATVARGTVVGIMGNEGASYGTHVHVEVQVGGRWPFDSAGKFVGIRD